MNEEPQNNTYVDNQTISFRFLKFLKDNWQLFKALMIIRYDVVYNTCQSKTDDINS